MEIVAVFRFPLEMDVTQQPQILYFMMAHFVCAYGRWQRMHKIQKKNFLFTYKTKKSWLKLSAWENQIVQLAKIYENMGKLQTNFWNSEIIVLQKKSDW